MAVVISLFNGFHSEANLALVKADEGCISVKFNLSNGKFVTLQLLNQPR